MNRKILRALSLAVATLFLQLAMTGCHTMKGAGEDIEAAGEGIKKKAEKHTGY